MKCRGRLQILECRPHHLPRINHRAGRIERYLESFGLSGCRPDDCRNRRHPEVPPPSRCPTPCSHWVRLSQLPNLTPRPAHHPVTTALPENTRNGPLGRQELGQFSAGWIRLTDSGQLWSSRAHHSTSRAMPLTHAHATFLIPGLRAACLSLPGSMIRRRTAPNHAERQWDSTSGFTKSGRATIAAEGQPQGWPFFSAISSAACHLRRRLERSPYPVLTRQQSASPASGAQR